MQQWWCRWWWRWLLPSLSSTASPLVAHALPESGQSKLLNSHPSILVLPFFAVLLSPQRRISFTLPGRLISHSPMGAQEHSCCYFAPTASFTSRIRGSLASAPKPTSSSPVDQPAPYPVYPNTTYGTPLLSEAQPVIDWPPDKNSSGTNGKARRDTAGILLLFVGGCVRYHAHQNFGSPPVSAPFPGIPFPSLAPSSIF